jgi:hypothetical protein
MLTSGPMTFHSDARIFIMTVAAEPTFLDTNILQNVNNQVHDTNIVATMLVYGIRRILTNNPDDFAPFASVTTIVPLRKA